jgi:hypothetical protein
MGTQALRLGDENSDAGRVFGRYVTTSYFDALGAAPALGRLFGGNDSDEPAQPFRRAFSSPLDAAVQSGSRDRVVARTQLLDGR